MEVLNLKMNKRQWAAYHRLERKDKKQRLRKLSEKEGFIILKDLHRFTYRMNVDTNFSILDIDKIKTLAYIHNNVFGKVKR